MSTEEKTLKRRRRFFNFCLKLAKPATKLFFNYSWEPLPEIEGPYLLLCNHNSDCDPGFVALAAGKQIAFVGTENIARMGFLGKILMKMFDLILHYKGTVGSATVRTILKKLKSGTSVALFPEGNRSFNGLTCPIPPATAKMARISGATLVTYRLTGGYFTTPRWSNRMKKGRVTGSIAGIYSPAELAAMSADEIGAVIERDLFVDAYADQEKDPVAFKGKKLAEGLESTLFMCPRCRKIGTLKTEDDRLFCSCGFEAKYSEFGYLETAEGEKLTITGLDLEQRAMTEGLLTAPSGEILFSDSARFRVINTEHELVSETEVTLSATSDALLAGDTVIPFSDIEGIAVNQKNLLLIHSRNVEGHVEFRGDSSFSALKYLYLVRAACGSINGTL